MSVVRVKDRTTNSEVIFTANNQSINSLLFVSPGEAASENFSIDMRLGDGWNENYSQNDTNLIKIDGSITVLPFSSIVVEVAEEIRVPHNRYGIVLPTGSLFLAKGVLVTAAKVEPAFHGKLKVRLYNTTRQKVVINKGDKVGSIIFFTTDATVRAETIYRRGDISVRSLGWYQRVWMKIRENKLQIANWLIPMTTAFAVVALNYYLNHKPTDKPTITPATQTDSSQTENKEKKVP